MAQAIYLETTAAGGVTWEEVEEAQLKEGPGGGSTAEPRKKLSIKIPKWCGKWVVSMDEYKDGVVGAKSKNLAGVTPASVQVFHTTPCDCPAENIQSRIVPCSIWKHRSLKRCLPAIRAWMHREQVELLLWAVQCRLVPRYSFFSCRHVFSESE